MTGIDDEEVRGLLRSIDPARALSPLSREEFAEHVSAATRPPGSTAVPSTRRRSPWIVVGVGALSAGAAATLLLPFALGAGGGAASTLVLPATGGPMDMCAPITPEALAPADLAFRAEVASIDGSRIALHVLDRLAGEIGDTVEVTQAEESVVDGAPIAFERGVDYLLAADGGVILTCGLSGPDSPELSQVYREAFAQR